MDNTNPVESSSLFSCCSFARALECNNRGVDTLKSGNFRDGIQHFRKSLTLLRRLIITRWNGDFCPYGRADKISAGCSCPLRAVISPHGPRSSTNPRCFHPNDPTINREDTSPKEDQLVVAAPCSSNSAEPILHQYQESRCWYSPLETHAVFDDFLYIDKTSPPLIAPSPAHPTETLRETDSHQEDGRLVEPSRVHAVLGVSSRDGTGIADDPAPPAYRPYRPECSQTTAALVDITFTAVVFNCALANHLMHSGNVATPQATGVGSQGTLSSSKEKAIALYRTSIALLTLEKPRATSTLTSPSDSLATEQPPEDPTEKEPYCCSNGDPQLDLTRDVILMASLNNLLCLMDQNDPLRQPFVSTFTAFMSQCASKAAALEDQRLDEAQQSTRAHVETNTRDGRHAMGNVIQNPLEDLNMKWFPTILGNAILMQMESLGTIRPSHCSPAA